MKKFLPWIIASGVIMLGLPCLAVTFLEGDSGMATCLILLFAFNTIFFAKCFRKTGTGFKAIIKSGLCDTHSR